MGVYCALKKPAKCKSHSRIEDSVLYSRLVIGVEMKFIAIDTSRVLPNEMFLISILFLLIYKLNKAIL